MEEIATGHVVAFAQESSLKMCGFRVMPYKSQTTDYAPRDDGFALLGIEMDAHEIQLSRVPSAPPPTRVG